MHSSGAHGTSGREYRDPSMARIGDTSHEPKVEQLIRVYAEDIAHGRHNLITKFEAKY